MKFDSLKGKTIIITGGGGGFGETMAKDFAAQGSNVVLVDQTIDNAQKIARQLKDQFNISALAIQCDIADTDSVKAMVEKVKKKFGGLDVLINNAAVGYGNPIESYDDKEWQETLDVNLTGTYYCTKHALGPMKEQSWGRIINISSIQGKTGFPYTGAYAATKHAVVGLSKITAAEVSRHGITVNAVCPGFADGAGQKRQDASLKRDEDYTGVTAEEQRQHILDAIPLGRRVTPAEISAMVVFLSTAEASGVTGQAIAVDGGMINIMNIPRPPEKK